MIKNGLRNLSTLKTKKIMKKNLSLAAMLLGPLSGPLLGYSYHNLSLGIMITILSAVILTQLNSLLRKLYLKHHHSWSKKEGLIYITLGTSLALTTLAGWPKNQETSIIIQLGFILTGLVWAINSEVAHKQSGEHQFNFKRFGKKSLSLIIIVLSAASCYQNFGQQTIWLPIVGLIIITFLVILEADNLKLNKRWLDKYDFIFFSVFILFGLISTFYQFRQVTVLGINLPLIVVMALVLGATLLLLDIWAIRRKKRRWQKEKDKKFEERALITKKEREENEKENNKRQQEMEKRLSADNCDLWAMVTVSEIKQKLIWENQMHLAIQVAKRLLIISHDDVVLKNVLQAFSRLEEKLQPYQTFEGYQIISDEINYLRNILKKK